MNEILSWGLAELELAVVEDHFISDQMVSTEEMVVDWCFLKPMLT